MGNPLSYKGRTLTWQGRRLISYGIENKKATYSYDFNNVRTSKIATDGTTSITSKYIYDGNNLIAEQRTVKGPDKDKSVWLYYIYGVDGIAGFNYNGVTYLYRKNIQGDITHIYRKDGNKDLVEVAHYAYDAFGNTEILSETDKIGSLNPFRYRGYYFDIETKLYYLISRYYDPETGRFISADSIEYLDPETLGGLNLYAYCCNNPVMMVDEDGTMPKWLKWLLGAVVVVAISFATAGIAGAAALAVGSALGVGSALVSATVGGALIGGLITGGVELISQGITSNWETLDFGALAIETFTGAAYGGIAGMMGSTTSAALRLGLRGGLVALSGINTALHGINDNKSFKNIMADVGLSMLSSVLIQAAFIGLNARNGKLSSDILKLYSLDGALFRLRNFFFIGLIAAGKNLWGNKNTWINFVL